MASDEFLLGEFRRSLDDRYRLSIPGELHQRLLDGGGECILAKEMPGALSLWGKSDWGDRLEKGVEVVQSKMRAGRLEGRIEDVQALGRLLSTRHRDVQITGRGRILIPEGYREFLGVEPGGEVLIVGAAVCVEIWRPDSWFIHLEEKMPEFRHLLDRLAD